LDPSNESGALFDNSSPLEADSTPLDTADSAPLEADSAPPDTADSAPLEADIAPLDTADSAPLEADSSPLDATDTSIVKLLGDHPKGSTVAHALDEKCRIEETKKETVVLFQQMQSRANITKERLQKGALTGIILECMNKNSLNSASISISEKTIWQQWRRNTKCGTHGPKSPLLEIEILQLANIGFLL
jgi:hypothetical protein